MNKMNKQNKREFYTILTISVVILALLIGICVYLFVKKSNSQVELIERNIYAEELPYSYSKVGFGDLTIDKDNNGDILSLYDGEQEVEFPKGMFAHAYSTIVYDNLSTLGLTYFETTFGVNKTARVNNTQTSLKFIIYLDNVERFVSQEFNAYTSYDYVKLDIKGVDRICLVVDSLGTNGNDHGVWADTKFYYYNDIKPSLIAEDLEFASPRQVTKENILYHARATNFDGQDISNQITYVTNYDGGVGVYDLTYKVNDNGVVAEKKVKLQVLNQDRYITDADIDYLTTPFANTLYYGRWCLNLEGRRAYDYCMETLLKTNILTYGKNTITFNLQDNGIYIYPNQVAKIKEYLINDEARLYFLYHWVASETGGTSHTTKNGLVDTMTYPLYNGSGQYYEGQDNFDAYLSSQTTMNKIFNKISVDMSDAQIVKVAQSTFSSTIKYANVNYADDFYGAFVTYQCICSGYARGFSFVLQRLGIKPVYNVGQAGGAHAWNNVFIEGNWYLCDPTWGDGYCLLGKDNSSISGRTYNYNYSIMPVFCKTDYDRELMNYPLFSMKDNNLIKVNSQLNLNDLIIISNNIKDKAPIVSIDYLGTFNNKKAGDYVITVTAKNKLGNIVSKEVTITVYNSEMTLNNYTPLVEKSNNVCNTAVRKVSLYLGGQEVEFEDGLYIKAYQTISLTYDLTNTNSRYFSTYFGVDKVIRDNVSYGGQVNATVKIYVDNELVYQKSSIKWKQDYDYVAIKLNENSTSLKIEVTDTTGQGGMGFGSPSLYV